MISSRQVLGIRFFNGNVDEVVRLMFQHGGLLVAPSGTCFARLCEDEVYRRAVLAADLAIADSGLMVLLWRLLQRENVERVSGLGLWASPPEHDMKVCRSTTDVVLERGCHAAAE